ncbi:hypothetical protein D1631_16810 [Chryseobacterium nematophagum]|uniref:Lipid/polyisoprenoid-binding YceI-like domain-containing protein n=1 Tax=Chryseobacterium nematophagum TaxID=2305228 RepID=A0A3M7TIU7_9FLAO|nr:ankyrin repeat domain-containing protein [Chryseobacterium nematophagum]RNA63461.1 hypothetical protein D1631_16810 [Chryseobacterium nematophagum]
MNKTVLMSVLLFFCNHILAQKYSSNIGKVTFEASIPLLSDIYAQDDKNVVALNADNGELASVSLVTNFNFKNKLMQEHFNESYAESSQYPKTIFKGKILDFDKNKLKETPQNFTIQGTMSFHGVEQEITSLAEIYTTGDKIYIEGSFVTKPSDYKVKVPKMVIKKVAKNVKVVYSYVLAKSKSIFDIARSGTVAEVQEMMKRDPNSINQVNEQSFSPLILACYRGNVEVAKFLMDHVKDINYKSKEGTALSGLSIKYNKELVEYLLKKKGDPNIADSNGTTPLIWAVKTGNEELVKLLLEYKANKEQSDNMGVKPFEYAIQTKKNNIINLLKN